MNKLKELWSYAVFRFIVLAPAIWLGLVFSSLAMVDWRNITRREMQDFVAGWSWWIAALLVILWVWRKPIWRLVKQAIGFLNKAAE